MPTIQDFREGNVIIDFSEKADLERLKTICKLAFPEDTTTPSGNARFYGKHNRVDNEWGGYQELDKIDYDYGCVRTVDQIELPGEKLEVKVGDWLISNTGGHSKIGQITVIDADFYWIKYKENLFSRSRTDLRLATPEEIEAAGGPKAQPSKGKITGYKWKNGFRNQYLKAVLAILGDKESNVLKASSTYDFTCNSMSKVKLREAGVLDLWFEPVDEPEIKEVVLRRGDGIKLNAKISSEGIIATADGSVYSFGDKYIKIIENILSKVADNSVNGHQLRVNTLDIGCQKGINVYDIQSAIKIYNTIK